MTRCQHVVNIEDKGLIIIFKIRNEMKKIFIVTMILGTFLFAACSQGNTNKKAESETPSMEMTKGEHAMLKVQGSCEMCKDRIETAAKSEKGVSMAHWDADKKELHLDFDSSQTNLDAISKAIAKAGHDTDKDKADQAAYDALPGCCKYKG